MLLVPGVGESHSGESPGGGVIEGLCRFKSTTASGIREVLSNFESKFLPTPDFSGLFRTSPAYPPPPSPLAGLSRVVEFSASGHAISRVTRLCHVLSS